MISLSYGSATKEQKGKEVFISHKRIGAKNDGVKRGIRLFIILLLWAVALFIILAVEKKILMDLLTWKSWNVHW